jgi:hypothetical protein
MYTSKWVFHFAEALRSVAAAVAMQGTGLEGGLSAVSCCRSVICNCACETSNSVLMKISVSTYILDDLPYCIARNETFTLRTARQSNTRPRSTCKTQERPSRRFSAHDQGTSPPWSCTLRIWSFHIVILSSRKTEKLPPR